MPPRGLAILSFLQAFHGVDVYGGHVKLALNGAGQVLQIEVGSLVPALGVGTRATLAPEGAVAAALSALGQKPPGELQRLTSANERWVRFLNPLGGTLSPDRTRIDHFARAASFSTAGVSSVRGNRALELVRGIGRCS